MSKKVKVAFCNRPNWDNPLGGDGVQMLKTKEALEKNYEIEIDIITEAAKINSRYDIVHIFNYVTTEVTHTFFAQALKYGIPIASSSIYWDYSYIYSSISRYLFRKKFTHCTAKLLKFISTSLAKIIDRPKLLTKGTKKEYRYFIKSSDIVLPNSQEEADLLQKFCGIDISNKVKIVYNGYTPVKACAVLSKEDFKLKYGLPEDYVLQVGRIETIKNQINVLYALKDNPNIPIIFIGKVVEENYYRKVKRLAEKRGNVLFIDSVPHEEMNSFYKYAALHILPSLRESPGLVSLEALSNGCPIIVSNEAYTPVNTYFSNQEYIVDPLDIETLHDTLLKAYKYRKVECSGFERFTWDNAAAQTWAAYQKII